MNRFQVLWKVSKKQIMDQAGAMYELNLLIFPTMFGGAGYYIGALYNHPRIGAGLAAVVGFIVGMLIIGRSFQYGIQIICFFPLLPLLVFIPDRYKMYYAITLCAAPLIFPAVGALLSFHGK